MFEQPLPRRRFLKLFAATGAWATSASIALQLTGCDAATEHQQRTHTEQFGTLLAFNEAQASTLFALAQTFITNAQDPAQIITVVKRLDEEMYFVKQDISESFKLALDFLEYLPMAYGHFSRVSRMSIEQRSAFLTSIQDSSIEAVRVAVSGCRMVILVCYYDQESTWANIGYDGTFSRMPEKLSAQRLHYQQQTQQNRKAIANATQVLK